MLPENLGEIDAAHLQRLVTDQVPESRHLEYKRELPGPTSWSPEKFRDVVASYANDGPGHLVIGVIEDGGIPTEIAGCAADDPDAAVLRLDQLVRDGLDPGYSQHRIRAVPVADGRYVFVLWCPLSFARPHRLNTGGRVPARSAAGTRQLSMVEVREMVLQTYQLADRVREFRSRRVAAINAGNTPVSMEIEPTLIAHLLPQTAFVGPLARPSPYGVIGQDGVRLLRFNDYRGYLENLEGTVWFSRSGETTASYVHVYRNGIIEAAACCGRYEQNADGDGIWKLSLRACGNILNDSLPNWLAALLRMGMGPPFTLMLSMVRVANVIATANLRYMEEDHRIDRDVLEVPDVQIPWPSEDLAPALRPALDILWQAWGYRRCANFNDEGLWIPPR